MGTCRRGEHGEEHWAKFKPALHPGLVHWWSKAPSRTLNSEKAASAISACASAHLWSLGQDGGGYLGSPLRDPTPKGTVYCAQSPGRQAGSNIPRYKGGLGITTTWAAKIGLETALHTACMHPCAVLVFSSSPTRVSNPNPRFA